MIRRSLLLTIVVLIIYFAAEAKSLDPYKVLGVNKNATQREIQKAFHKLSLRYHPDKNKNKGAQEKFAEINNAYELLSDEERRKNYDLFGDDKSGSEPNAGDPRDHGHGYFTGRQGNTRFSFRPGEWQYTGGGGRSKSYSFAFGNPNGESSFGFDLSDIFSNVFGGDVDGNGGPFGAFSGSHGPGSDSRAPPENLPSVNSRMFKKEISDQGLTWLILSYIPTLQNIHYYESIIAEATNSLQGALKNGGIDCVKEHSFCNDMGMYPRRVPRLFVYSYKQSGSGSLLEYNGDLKAKNLKEFCINSLPRLSKRVGIDQVESLPGNAPRLVLLSTKKDTPVIWRALSGLHHKRFNFYDTLVDDVSRAVVKRLAVKELPAVVGWLSDGEKHVLKTGIRVKDLKSGIRDLSALIDGFERLNKAAASSGAHESGEESGGKIRLLTASNFDDVCGETIPVCVIGVFRSSTAKAKVESVLTTVTRKSLLRRRMHSSSREPVSYALLDGRKYAGFLKAFQRSASPKFPDRFLLAYKPKRRKFTVFTNELTLEEAEKFISSVLNGDVHFTETTRRPSFV